MGNKKIFILLPDGVGLRNFAFTDFHKEAVAQGFAVEFWNNTPFDLSRLGFSEKKINNATPHFISDLYKRARTEIDLTQNVKRSGDQVYESYRFPLSDGDLKLKLKSLAVVALRNIFNSDQGVQKIRRRMKSQERKTAYYQSCLKDLQGAKPDIVFCTNQRPLSAVAPIIAAQDLGIPTATFIFSWDNLPKATMIIETDYYFVWSNHMKAELLYYYPYIKENQIFVTGTPQFEPHFDASLIETKAVFFEKYGLDTEKKYICFSGDDITTSPDDPQYLEDAAAAVRKLNGEGSNLGIVFRRCPVDFSDRYDKVLTEYSDVIVSVAPVWKKMGANWNAILPTLEDLILQVNTIFHTEFVINLGSSMVFDYACFDKPCMYINYDAEKQNDPNWSVEKIYKFVHFQSMPDKNAVIWIDDPKKLDVQIKKLLLDSAATVKSAQLWFEKINEIPANQASDRIVSGIKSILSK